MLESRGQTSNRPSSSRRNPNPAHRDQQPPVVTQPICAGGDSPIGHPSSSGDRRTRRKPNRDAGINLVGRRVPSSPSVGLPTREPAREDQGRRRERRGTPGSRKRSMRRGRGGEAAWEGIGLTSGDRSGGDRRRPAAAAARRRACPR